MCIRDRVKHGEQFKRGIIVRCESPTAKTFKVRLIDVGSHIIVPACDIRMAAAIPHLKHLGESPCAEEFVLGDALARPGTWSIEEVQNANRLIRMHGEVRVIGTVANKALIVCPIYDNQNLVTLAALLVQRGVALFADAEIVKVAVLRKHAHPSQFATIPPPRIPPQAFLRYQYASPEIGPPLHGPSARLPPGLGLYPRMPMPAPKPPKPEIRPQHYRVDTLPVGSHHEVFVSHVIEGAQSFMVQLKVIGLVSLVFSFLFDRVCYRKWRISQSTLAELSCR